MSNENQTFLRHDWSQIERVFYMTAPAPCPYLPNRTERKLITALDHGDDEAFDALSWSGFRRSHEIAYRPACPSCNACMSARIDVASHRTSRTHRKIINRNRDLTRSVRINECTPEHWALFDRYIRARHGVSEMALMTPDDLRMMIDQSTVESGLLEWRDSDGALKACMLFDAMEDGLSAVYSFFCPDETRRSLGTFCILDTVEHLKLLHLPKFYLGYWIKGSETMAYKIGFSGVEIHQHGTWKAVESSLSAS
jgi:leucyl-tRNA---protein transferase